MADVNINAGEITSVRLKETTVPATPAAGYRKLYAKTSGLFLVDDAGNEYQISPDVIGTAYQILRVNSGATGVEYASVGRVLISEQTPTSTGTVTWSSIPATYKSLELEYVLRSTEAAVQSNMSLYFNNDTTAANYRYTRLLGYAASSIAASGGDGALLDDPPAASATAGACASGVVKINNYAGTSFRKQASGVSSGGRDASSLYEICWVNALEWESTAAINRVDLVLAAGNFDSGSTFRLYGVY